MWSLWTWRRAWSIWAGGRPPIWISSSWSLARLPERQTYRNVKRLAADLGVKRVRVVANKIRCAEDEAFHPLRHSCGGPAGTHSPESGDHGRRSEGLVPSTIAAPSALAEIRSIKAILDQDEK